MEEYAQMSDFDFCEYAVEKKKEGAYRNWLCAAAILSLVFAVCFFFFILPAVGFTAGLLIFGIVCVVLWYFSRYTYIEYEYSVSGEFFSFASIYAKQYRKEIVVIDLKKSARKIAPYNGEFDGLKVTSVTDMRSSAKASNSYYVVYTEDKEQRAILFDATKKTVNTLFRQVPSVVTRSNELPEE